MIKENYEKPQITVNTFSIIDAVTTSRPEGGSGGVVLPDDMFENTTKPSIDLPDIDLK